MKRQIVSRANQLKLSNDHDTKKLGKIILKYKNNFNCYYCLDTIKTWRPRNNQFWVRFDGRGNYDVMRCRHCNDGRWNSCSHTNILNQNGIKIFRIGNNNVEDRINELRKLYKKKIEEPDAEWILYEKKTKFKKTTFTEMNVNVGKLAQVVMSSIRLHGGDLSAIATLAKELTIDMNSALCKENDHVELIKQEKNGKNQTVYLIMRLEKKKKYRNIFGKFFKSKKYTFFMKYMILIPDNDIARKKCIELMNDKIENRIDNYDI